jgi:hypothetical protein
MKLRRRASDFHHSILLRRGAHGLHRFWCKRLTLGIPSRAAFVLVMQQGFITVRWFKTLMAFH